MSLPIAEPGVTWAGPVIRDVLRRLQLSAGLLIIVVGLLIELIPGPGGIPIALVGLVLVLRSSRPAKRMLIRAQRKHPRFIRPLRRLLKGGRPAGPLLWTLWLRAEQRLLPLRWRRSARLRRGRRAQG